MKAGRALSLALAVNAALLLGCLNGSLIKTSSNKPPASPAPASTAGAATGTPNPGELGRAIKNLRTSFTGLAQASGKAIDAITADDERAIGQAAAINIIQQSGGLILEQGLITYVNAVANHVGLQGQRVVTGKDGVARINSRRFFVGVVNDDSMNAYALPGGYIILTRGLIENLTSESDLAWVLGHEISHIDNEDGLKALKGTVGSVAFAKEVAHFGAQKTDEETASFKNPAFFATVVDKIVEISFRLGMGKNDEREADSQGLMYATAAGYDAQGAKRVLELLATNPAKIRLFKSHDGPSDRLALLTRQIGGLTSGRLGIERFDRGCLQRLEAAKKAAAATAPASSATRATPNATPTPAAKQVANASPTSTPGSLMDQLRNANRQAEARSQERNEIREKAYDAITAAQERAVGQATAFNIINGAGGLVLEEGLVRYVNDVANIVASVGERTDEAKGKDNIPRVKARRVFVGILNNDSMDAFALPGGYILLTRGLLENLTCESDLAWVLGHELAHIDNEDGLAAMRTTINFQVAAGKEPNLDDPAFFGVVADKLSDVLYRVGYDKGLEAKADQRGLEYAVKAGYDSQGARRVLELLGTNPLKFTQRASHDTPARRIAVLGALLDSAPDGRLGVERFDKSGLLRLEAAKKSAANVP